MNPFSSLRRLLALALLFACATAQAQITVDLQIKRRTFMINEPILATVSITNQTGREVLLADTQEGGPWFSFQITGNEGRLIPPRNANYELQPLAMHPGETVKRTVNLNELYALGDYGPIHLRSSIYFAELGKYFGSKLVALDLTEGQLIWKQTVGLPQGAAEGEDAYRDFSLLTMDQEGGRSLYLRVQGKSDGIVYGCFNLGRIIAGFKPDVQFDSGNNIAVLSLVAPKTFSLSRVAVDGHFLSQATYVTPKNQPFLRKLANGTLQIVGAVREEKVAQAQLNNGPKLSDRPAGF